MLLRTTHKLVPQNNGFSRWTLLTSFTAAGEKGLFPEAAFTEAIGDDEADDDMEGKNDCGRFHRGEGIRG